MAHIIIIFITISIITSLIQPIEAKNSKRPNQHLVYQTYRKPNFSARSRPNILLVLTDDQDAELGSLQFMPRLSELLGGGGTTYTNGYVTTPMCCPSRSSLLTGLYTHNHHVFTNNDNCSSTAWVENHEKRTFATYLQQSGYTTAYFGKYLNKYDGQRVPPGWDKWHGLIKNSAYYNYSLNVDGARRSHGHNHARDYLPDLITNRTLKFVTKVAQSPASRSPFLAVMSYPAPHGPEDAAPQYQALFHNVTTHHTPSYDFAPNPDKEWVLRVTDKMAPTHRSFTDLLQTKRLQTLQSVDEGVARVVARLRDTGQLDNTYIFYTSDHGYHLGQFGLVKGKAFPYEFDTKVPFLVRGPGVRPGAVRSHPVLNIDLAPTFLDIAGLEKPPHMDGKSIIPTIRNENRKFRQWFMIERGKMTFQKYAKVSQNSVLHNNEDLSLLKKNKLTKQELLEIQCRKPKYQSPCKMGQRWVCVQKDGVKKKISRCSSAKLKSLNINGCQCNPGEVMGVRVQKLGMAEKRMQKKFLKHNLDVKKFRNLQPKFLKTVPTSSVLSRRGRSAINGEEEEDREVLAETVLTDMADDEIQEVDLLVEDIAEEIRDLKNSSESAAAASSCRLGAACDLGPVTAAAEDPWRYSRSSIRQQMDQLRRQLKELKQIRKFLASKNPPARRQSRVGSNRSEAEAELCRCDTREEIKDRIKHEREDKRLRRKLERLKRKEAKRLKMESKMRRKVRKHDHCKGDTKMNCFSHDNNHWKTPPLWTGGPFCACTNSNNNTYWCVRNINATDNYLYCEYVTGMVTYYDLRVDPHQLRNLLHTLTSPELNWMHKQVRDLRDFSAENRFWEKKRKIDEARAKEKLRKMRRKKRRENLNKWKRHHKNIY